MNYSIFSLFLICLGSFVLNAQETDSIPMIGVEDSFIVKNATLNRNGEYLTVDMLMEFPDMKMKSTQATVFTPMIVNGTDTTLLPSVGLYGRTRWYQTERSRKMPIGGKGSLALRYHKEMEPVAYHQDTEYMPWMDGSTLILKRTDYGCAGCKENEVVSYDDLASYYEQQIVPQLQFYAAVADTIKVRELSGRAYVDFPVNKIVIYPEYRNNHYELGKIIATIDSVKNDPDITVTSITIKGTASPEGPYDNNVYLAKNRTIALKEYVTNLYNFPKDFIQTSYEPVDWEGLREWLEANNIENKEAILAIVNSDIEPFARNSKIKADFPAQYQWLLTNVYAALRHSDYRIEYTIRQFSDVAEIAEVIKTAPQKLSLNEMYLLANSLEPGSDEYNEVFEVAVRMYPDDEIANLNAANTAIMRGDYAAAERYLNRAGESGNAVYTRGVLKGLQGDYVQSRQLLEKAIQMGVTPDEEFYNKIKQNQ